MRYAYFFVFSCFIFCVFAIFVFVVVEGEERRVCVVCGVCDVMMLTHGCTIGVGVGVIVETGASGRAPPSVPTPFLYFSYVLFH